MNLKDLIGFKDRRYGFYVNIVFGILLLVAGSLYVANFQESYIVIFARIEYNVAIGTLLLLGGILTLLLSIFKVTAAYAPFVGGVAVLTSLCLFIEDVYMFVMNCFVDIDYHVEHFFNPIFLVPLVMIVVTFVVGVITCFLPQVKYEEKAKCEQCQCENKEEATDEN